MDLQQQTRFCICRGMHRSYPLVGLVNQAFWPETGGGSAFGTQQVAQLLNRAQWPELAAMTERCSMATCLSCSYVGSLGSSQSPRGGRAASNSGGWHDPSVLANDPLGFHCWPENLSTSKRKRVVPRVCPVRLVGMENSQKAHLGKEVRGQSKPCLEDCFDIGVLVSSICLREA